MPTPSLRIVNASGTMIVDRNGRSLNYLGKVTSGTVTPPTGDATSGPGRAAGEVAYSFTASAGTPVIACVEIPSGCVVRCISQLVSGSTISVRLYCGDAASVDGWGFQTQVQPAVYVFGLLTSASGVGLKMRNDSNALTHVFTDTDGAPLYIRGRVSESGSAIDTSSTRSIPTLSKLAICGFPNHLTYASSVYGGGFYDNVDFSYGWKQSGAGSMVLQQYTQQKYRGDFLGNYATPYASESILIEAAGL